MMCREGETEQGGGGEVNGTAMKGETELTRCMFPEFLRKVTLLTKKR
jgi:hypothetical protein